ncbi:MAG TPA: RNA 2',3'-cyclic phosphodiesterase [Syntrophorhabdaceae bacterium]|nr:RNA 2',3'-cyclic phosphodiesterase [Syntrophorhabdaceae bacterium]HQM80848.1 RNA 2',3'-cyclic phosphodiesterase [Syntrophorhabdaceae bacterium]
MRVFLALEIPDEIKAYLRVVTNQMAARIHNVKWVNERGQHITLKFFGEQEEKRVREIGDALSGIERLHAPIAVTLKDIEAFPDRKRARVIVVALEKGVDNIRMIFHDIEDRLSGLGVEKERRSFRPHITLGRMKTPGPLLDRDIVDVDKKDFVVRRMVLFQSILQPAGAVYAPIWELEFNKTI